jgi:hypothetical protein
MKEDPLKRQLGKRKFVVKALGNSAQKGFLMRCFAFSEALV